MRDARVKWSAGQADRGHCGCCRECHMKSARLEQLQDREKRSIPRLARTKIQRPSQNWIGDAELRYKMCDALTDCLVMLGYMNVRLRVAIKQGIAKRRQTQTVCSCAIEKLALYSIRSYKMRNEGACETCEGIAKAPGGGYTARE